MYVVNSQFTLQLVNNRKIYLGHGHLMGICILDGCGHIAVYTLTTNTHVLLIGQGLNCGIDNHLSFNMLSVEMLFFLFQFSSVSIKKKISYKIVNKKLQQSLLTIQLR